MPAPITRNHATVCGSTSSNSSDRDRRADVLGNCRQHEQRFGLRCAEPARDRTGRRARISGAARRHLVSLRRDRIGQNCRATCHDDGVNRQINPTTIAPPAANYAHAVLTEAPTRWLHTSGVVPTSPDGSTPDAIGAQAGVVWSNISAMLSEATMKPADIVSVTTYVVAGQPLADVMAARDRVLGDHRAASTLVTVPELAQPQWLMEIAVVAAASS